MKGTRNDIGLELSGSVWEVGEEKERKNKNKNGCRRSWELRGVVLGE